MPRIIENLQTRLVEEARRQSAQKGYSAVTIRSVASACGVGVGTVYNYFPSKDDLLAAFLLADWKECIARIRQTGEKAQGPEPVLRCIYGEVQAYLEKHKSIFRDTAAAAVFGSAMGKYHGLLRAQLAAPLRRFCSGDFAADFAAEALLTWTVEGAAPEALFPMLQKLFER